MKKYPKLKDDNECAFPEREDCNYGEGYSRCEFMKYNNEKSILDPSRWECKCPNPKNLIKSDNNGNKSQEGSS